MRENPTESLPDSFAPHEFGLMTREEFLHFLNPEGKYHPSNAYDVSLSYLNPLFPISSVQGRTYSKDYFQNRQPTQSKDVVVFEVKEPSGTTFWAFLMNEEVRAVLRDGVLYRDRWFGLLESRYYGWRDQVFDLFWNDIFIV